MTRISGIGESTSSSPPRVSSVMPPTVDSVARELGFSREERKCSQNQHQRGKPRSNRFSAKAAIKMKTMPTVPGITAPG